MSGTHKTSCRVPIGTVGPEVLYLYISTTFTIYLTVDLCIHPISTCVYVMTFYVAFVDEMTLMSCASAKLLFVGIPVVL